MKKLVFILCACIAISSTYAQDFTKSLEGMQWVKIASKADIVIKTHSKNELLIKIGSRAKTPSRAKGLKLVGEGGSDNTDVGFHVVEDGSNLFVRNLRKSEGAEIYLPENQNISVVSKGHGDIKIYGFKGEVEASAQLNGSILIVDVTGPVTADALNGSLDISFTTVNQQIPISLYTTNGALDVTIPSSTPANLSLSSINGEIYTNFDLKLPEEKGLKAVYAKKVKGSINKGGVHIQLKSTNGNIYLRKE